jgi:hypothetical protein
MTTTSTTADFSGSSYGRVRTCPGSAVLPRFAHVGPGEPGNAIHEHMALRVTHGIDFAVEQLGAICARWELGDQETGIVIARCKGFEWTPPRGAWPEVALCLFEDGTVRRIKGGRGRYELPAGGVFPMTIDALWSEPEPLEWPEDARPWSDKPVDLAMAPRCPPGSTLWVLDLKSGQDRHVAPVEHNAQAHAGALLGARWTGAARVVPAICYVRKGPGDWDVPERDGKTVAFGFEELSAIETEILRTRTRVQQQRLRLVRGEPLELVEGSHCTYCDARAACPAKTAMVKAILDDPQPMRPVPLAPDQARRGAEMIPQLEGLVRYLKDALRAHVDASGEAIDLGDGNVWGPNLHEKTVIDAAKAVDALLEVGVPAARAGAAVKVEITRAAIEAAVKDAQLGKIAPSVRRVFAILQENGGLSKRPEIWYSAHRAPPLELPPLRVIEGGDDGAD